MAETKFYTSLGERISYGTYFFGQNIFFAFIMQYLMLFYTDYRFMSPAVVGLIFLVARTWDAINDPLFGIIVDKSRLKSGKFKPWITIASLIIPVIAILIFAMPEGLSAGSKIAYASVTYILFGMAYTVSDIPIFALATAMTNNIQERTTIISIGRLFASIAIIALGALIMPVIMAAGWLKTAVIFSGVAFVMMIPLGKVAKERFVREKSEPTLTLKEIFQYLAQNKYLLIFYLSVIVYSLTNTTLTVINYIAKYMLGGEQMIAPMMMATFVPMLVLSAVVPTLTKKIDKFHLYMFFLALNIVSSLVSYFAGYANITVFFVLAVIRGFALTAGMVMPYMFAADCVEYSDYKYGKRAEGTTFAVQTFTTKFITAISGAIVGIVMTRIGYDGSLAVQSETTIKGLWQLYLLLPVAGFLVSIIPFSFYKLRDKDVQIMAQFNQKQISREEAVKSLSREY